MYPIRQEYVGDDGECYMLSRVVDGLLVDCGALGNCTGSHQVIRHDQAAAAHGLPPSTHSTRPKPMSLSGVGDGVKVCREDAHVQGYLEGDRDIRYDAAVLPDSDVPSLLGLNSMARLNMFMGMTDGVLTVVPKGAEKEIKWPHGTSKLQLVSAASGHLVLPINHFPSASSGHGSSDVHNAVPRAPARAQ